MPIVGDELRRHRLDLPIEEGIHHKRFDRIVAMMPEGYLVVTALRRLCIDNPSTKTRTQPARRFIGSYLLGQYRCRFQIFVPYFKPFASDLFECLFSWEIGRRLVQMKHANLEIEWHDPAYRIQQMDEQNRIFTARKGDHDLVVRFYQFPRYRTLRNVTRQLFLELYG